MIVPENMLQEAQVGSSKRVNILPLGLYTSGSYSIPGGYFWDDFSYIVVGAVIRTGTTSSDLVIYTASAHDGLLGNTSWVVSLVGASAVGISRVSATGFSVSTGTGKVGVTGVVGYLK